MGILSWASKAGKKVNKFFNPLQGKRYTQNIMPIGPAASKAPAVAKGAGSVIKSVYNSLKTATTKKTINPAAGVKGAKNVLKAIGSSVGVGALAGTLFGVGKTVSKIAVSGDISQVKDAPKTISHSAAAGAGLGFSPVGGAFGILEGAGTNVTDIAKNFYNILKGKGQSMMPDDWKAPTNPFKDMPDVMPISPVNNINISYPENMGGMMPQPQNIYFENPQVPAMNYTSPAFSPSISLGGGGIGDNLPLLMLLGAGIGGFALGRRKKRKKKKYKKRKKR